MGSGVAGRASFGRALCGRLLAAAVLIVLGGSSLTVAPATAAAQEPSERDLARARSQFRSGMAAGEQGRWEEARDAFEEAYGILPRPRILLNLASAQMHTGRLIDATASYRRFLDEVTSGPDVQYRAGVEDELGRLEARVARLRIEVDGARPGDRVMLDDRELSRADLANEVLADPGSHALVALRDGHEVAREPLALDEGERRDVTLRVEAALPAPGLEDSGTDVLGDGSADNDAGSGSVLSSPWLWVGVGAAVVGAVVITVIVASGGDPERRSGNFGDGRIVIE